MKKGNRAPNPERGFVEEGEYNQLVDKAVNYHNKYVASNWGSTKRDSIREISKDSVE